MKRFIPIILAAAALVLAAVSCEKAPQKVNLEIASYELPSSAAFGDKVNFTINVPEGADLSSVTAALIKDGKQLASTTVPASVVSTPASYGVSGLLEIPYVKNASAGNYDVMLVATGSSSERAEKTVQISLSHPAFDAVAFVADNGTRYDLSAGVGSVWSYTGTLPAALTGYFEGKTADGRTYDFGGANIDNVEFGSKTAMELYKYEEELLDATISFDVVSFKVVFPLDVKVVTIPETTDPAYPGTIDVTFKKGQLVDFRQLGDLWVDVDFFQYNGDYTYTFMAEGGNYRLTNQSDWGSLRVERLSSNGDLGTFGWDDSGNITVNEAIWCLGNYNFGKPDMRQVRGGRVWSDWETFDGYCMAKIDDYKYQITLRVYNLAQYKFFCTKLNWGDIYGTQYDMSNSQLNGCTNIYANALVGNGNFQQGMSPSDPNAIMYPETGIVIRFTFDVTNPQSIIVTAEDVTDQNLM